MRKKRSDTQSQFAVQYLAYATTGADRGMSSLRLLWPRWRYPLADNFRTRTRSIASAVKSRSTFRLIGGSARSLLVQERVNDCNGRGADASDAASSFLIEVI